MKIKQVYSVALLAFVLQACGESKEEKKLKNDNKNLRQSLGELAQDKEDLKRDLETLEAQTKRDSEALEAKAESETKLRQELTDKNNELVALTKKVKEKEADLVASKDKLKNLGQEKAQLEKTVAERNEVIGQLSKTIVELNEKITRTPNADELKKEIAQLKEQLDAEKSAKLAAETKIVSKDAEIAELTKRLDNPGEELQALREAQAKLQEKVDNLLKRSLTDVKGLWMTQKLSEVSDSECYKISFVDAAGRFSQGLACADGRVQITRFDVSRFHGRVYPSSSAVNTVGFEVSGRQTASSCSSTSTLAPSSDIMVFKRLTQPSGVTGAIFTTVEMQTIRGESAVTKYDLFIGSPATSSLESLRLTLSGAVSERSKAEVGLKFMEAHFNEANASFSLGCFDPSGSFIKQ